MGQWGPGLAVAASLRTVTGDAGRMRLAISDSSCEDSGSWGRCAGQLAPRDPGLIGTGSRGAGDLVGRVAPGLSPSGRQ